MADTTNKDQQQHAKDQLARDAELRKQQEQQRAAMQGKPTPTQAENDAAALGETFDKHEEDGSQEMPPFHNKQSEAQPGSTNRPYQTRQSTPKPQQP